MNTKKGKVPCYYPKCGERRIHHERPYKPRGTQMVEVPGNYDGRPLNLLYDDDEGEFDEC